MAGKVFINYRREDAPDSAGRLYDRLETEFPSEDLFMDVEGQIKPGGDAVEAVNAQVAGFDVVLVVIGSQWANLLTTRQGSPDHIVVIEIRAALDQGKRVIPVLVGGADMPRGDALPEQIGALAWRNAVSLRSERFRSDCQGLITALKENLAAAAQERSAQTETERKSAESARREAEAQAAARARAVEERGRAEAAAGLSGAEVRKAEELANWEFIKDRNDIQGLRDHLARFPSGTTERYAIANLDRLAWAGLGPTPAIVQLRAYLDEFPKGENASVAQARIAELEREALEAKAAEEPHAKETKAWGAVAASTDKAEIGSLLKDRPNGQHANGARARIAELLRRPAKLWHGVLLGASATIAILVLAVCGWWRYEEWLSSDPSLKLLTKYAEQALKASDTFAECATCPTMVVVPAGDFVMGSPESEIGRDKNESPQHQVTIAKPFAVSKFEVTIGQWDACVNAGACRRIEVILPDKGRPMEEVSWYDAKGYAKWLSNKTGKSYRLLTEAEWEYAARGGTASSYFWGNEVGDGHTNCDGCGSQWDKRSAPVGSFRANTLGLHDMLGSVREWVEDCYHMTYQSAPTDGSAWVEDDCRLRVVRGGDYVSKPNKVRSASRELATAFDAVNVFKGFRVARTLAP